MVRVVSCPLLAISRQLSLVNVHVNGHVLVHGSFIFPNAPLVNANDTGCAAIQWSPGRRALQPTTEHVHAHVYVYVYVPEERSRRNKEKSSVLLDSGVRRNDDSSTKSEPNDPNEPNDLNMDSDKQPPPPKKPSRTSRLRLPREMLLLFNPPGRFKILFSPPRTSNQFNQSNQLNQLNQCNQPNRPNIPLVIRRERQ